MFRIAELVGRLASAVGSHLGYDYPFELDRNITAYLAEVSRLGQSH